MAVAAEKPDLEAALTHLVRADAELASMGPTPFHVPIRGIEAVVAGAILALEPEDWWLPGLRERVGAILRDVPLERLVDGMAGAKPYRVAPPTGSPALRAPMAVGLALTSPGAAALCHLGVGSSADGAFHEALNLAGLLRPNVIFLVAVHPLTGDAPLGRQLAAAPSALAHAFSLSTSVVDGRSVHAVHAAVRIARAAGGPHLIEAGFQGDR